jgi:hypothetical protein
MSVPQQIAIEVIEKPNYWWGALVAILPVMLTFFLYRRKALSKK